MEEFTFTAADLGETALQEATLQEAYIKALDEVVRAAKPDDQGFTSITNIQSGVAALGKFDKEMISLFEWALMVQFVGADEPELYLVDASRFFEGVCAAVLEEEEGRGAVTMEDLASTNKEALDLVCEDLVKMIADEARSEDGTLDYSKPFKLFDENGDGCIPIDEFRRMLYRLNVDSLLREGQVMELMNRFDTDRTGVITIREFIAFATKETWGDDYAGVGYDFDQRRTMGASSHFGATGASFNSMALGFELEGPLAGTMFSRRSSTGNAYSDELAVTIAEKLRRAFPGQRQQAAAELEECLTAVDCNRTGNLSPGMVMIALRRAGLEPTSMKPVSYGHLSDVLPPLVETAMRNKMVAHGLARLELARIFVSVCIWGIGIEITFHPAHLLALLRLSVATCPDRTTLIAQVKSRDATTGNTTYSYKLGKASVFRKMDTNRGGVLSAKEFVLGLLKLGIGKDLKEKEVRRIFRAFDRSVNGSVNYREFCDFLLHGTLVGGPQASLGRDCADSWDDMSLCDTYETLMAMQSSAGIYPGYLLSRLSLSDGSDELFESHDPNAELYRKVAKALAEFAPSDSKKRKISAWFQNKSFGEGEVKESHFRDFLRKAGVDGTLSSREMTKLVDLLDPKGKGIVDYKKFLHKVLEKHCPKGKDPHKDITPLLHRIQEATALSSSQGKPYHALFRLSDSSSSGLVNLSSFSHTLKMLGAQLAEPEVQIIADSLGSRADGMVDYEELYRVLLRTPPPLHLQRRPFNTRYSGGGALQWPPLAAVPGSTFNFYNNLASSGNRLGAGNEEVAARIRQASQLICVIEKIQLWGPSFSLVKQFEFHDPRNKGFVTPEDFSMVMEQLGVHMSSLELQRLLSAFDRHSEGALDYMDFCSCVLFDTRDMDMLAHKLNARISDLHRHGIDVRSAFEMFDLSKTGFLNRKDFREALKKLQLPVTEHQLQSIQTKFAQIGDPDAISYEDFMSFISSSLPIMTMEAGIAMKDGGFAVNGSGFDGLRGNHTGSPILSKSNINAWYQQSADASQQRDFQQLHKSLRHFRHQRDLEMRAALDRSSSSATGGISQADYDQDQTHTLNLDEVHMGGAAGACGRRDWSRSKPNMGETETSRALQRQGFGPRSPTSPSNNGAGVWGSHTPLERKGSLSFAKSISNPHDWMCPVCFFAENKQERKLCAICSAPNPGAKTSQVLQACANCTFSNSSHSTSCDMCGEPLPFGRVFARQKQKPAQPAGGRRQPGARARDPERTGWDIDEDEWSVDEGCIPSKSVRLSGSPHARPRRKETYAQ
ncbi:unnamed protein product [Chrysoparadoxa australica]